MTRLFKTLIVTLILISMSVSMTGCVSYLVLENSKKKIAYNRAILRKDDVAIKAFQVGENGIGLGIDVSNLAGLTKQPFLQLGAALLDVGLIYGGYEAAKSFDSNDDNSGRNITITGDENTVTVGGDENNTDTSIRNY